VPIQIIKLTNGETIMTEVLDATDRVVTVLNPLEIKTEQYGKSRANMVAYLWMPMMEKENLMYIHQGHIVAMSHANQDLIDYYESAIERILYPEDALKRELEEQSQFEELLRAIREQANTNGVLH